ncbi:MULTISPECIES: TrbC family F-type conjugative pilus assembly protein [spotted fever group]|uniref:Type-F conjugative transfer system pilin assembly protein TrbC n=1 Tax=Rickettsia tamurae subsp. buchneri TaxID=1462938 RepID=A0A8E0WKZ3_9RICK|nr:MULTISPECIES: TrbC family F-type conjugative pilus assembly protein [spotted fever group]EER20882.1 type-F conjugative transfer system pilin assembly protein TrbC [Rickettsia endosymbiont of Ixodes scapularis]KDO02232.1 type-F conjugative transfer system pilin assembly protein TrbC [Rickettsia tamurae subsp. buchneri]
MILRTILLIFLIFIGSIASASNRYIFVSFSMSDEALKAYYRESEELQAILVIRGLVNNNFLDTRQKALDLSINFNIDPELFENYHVTSVPVIIEDDKLTGIKKVSGHIPLSAALELFKQG